MSDYLELLQTLCRLLYDVLVECFQLVIRKKGRQKNF